MTPSYNRRHFLRRSANVAASITAASLWTPPPPLLAQVGVSREALPPIDDPRVKALVQRGIEASRSAGADYVDVRLTHTFERRIFDVSHVGDEEFMTVGVRALVNGYWGFAAGPVWSADEMARLGQEATRHATTNALGKPRPTTLAPTSVVQDGRWTTPMQIDPFSLHPAEISDILRGVQISIREGRSSGGVAIRVRFTKQEKAFGSSEGSLYTQTLHHSSAAVEVTVDDVTRLVEGLGKSSVGLELIDEQRIAQRAIAIIDEIKADMALPEQPVDVGRYDVVLDAGAVAGILDGSIGLATELDRALGYEANAGGTSYLIEPSEMLGTYKVGSPLLTVTMNRTEPGGAATVAWDDEGVVPRPVTLVTQGILTDFQTTRESAAWLHPNDQHTTSAPQSTGSAYAPAAIDAPLTHTGNLMLQPASSPRTEDDLIGDMSKGIVFRRAKASADFQQLNGMCIGDAYEVRNGKRVARLNGAALIFRTPELWKSLTAIGGTSSTTRFSIREDKGQPEQSSFHSVTAVPAIFTQQTVVDMRRKA